MTGLLATRLGAAHVINARTEDAVEALRGITEGKGIDRTLEATGVPAVLRQAIDVLAPLGVCGIVVAPAPDAEVSMNILGAIVNGSSVVGINQGDAIPRESIPALIVAGTAKVASPSTSSPASIGSTTSNKRPRTPPPERSSSPC